MKLKLLDASFDGALALGVLAVLRDERTASKAANAMGAAFAESTRDYIQSGQSFKVNGSGTGRIHPRWKFEGAGAVVYVKAKHAVPIEQGSGIYGPLHRMYSIKPSKARILAFPLASGGYGFAREIHHPGAAAQPFFFIDESARENLMLKRARAAIEAKAEKAKR